MSFSQSHQYGYRLNDVTCSTTPCTVQPSTCRFFRTLRSLNHLECCILVILLFCTVCQAYPKDQRVTDSVANRNDFVCNVGDEHECVCGRFNGNLDGELIECTQFFGVRKMPVIKMTLKKISLEDRLHTNETYQQYFRRRVANLISDYCERQANDCPQTTLRIPKENVVIVRVNFLPRDRVELYIVILKNSEDRTLDTDTTMDPEKIKYILSAQIGPLSRVLGGVHIEELKTDSVKKINNESNAGLLTMIAVILVGFCFCYTIAVYRCCVQTRKKRRKQRKTQQQQKYGPNYGACTEKLLNYEKPNGKMKGSSVTSKDSFISGRRGKKSSDVRTPTTELRTPTYDDDRPSLDTRSFTRMFACDPSQLPAEVIYIPQEGDNQSEDMLLQSPPLSKKNSSPITNEGPQIPSMILVSASTPIPPEFCAPFTLQVETPRKAVDEKTLKSGAQLQTGLAYNPYERPLSRRGSRNSTPEQGEEFAEDREETPLPMGDEDVNDFIGDKIDDSADQTEKPSTDHRFSHWSSESESDNEVYQRLSEASEGEDDEKILYDKEGKRKKWNDIQKKNNSSDVESNFSDEDEKDQTEEEMMDRHQYERLKESPVPQVVIPSNLLELDSAP